MSEIMYYLSFWFLNSRGKGHQLLQCELFHAHCPSFHDYISMSSVKTPVQPEALPATVQLQKKKNNKDFGGNLSVNGKNSILKPNRKSYFIFGVKFQRLYIFISNFSSLPCHGYFKTISSLALTTEYIFVGPSSLIAGQFWKHLSTVHWANENC